MEENKILMRGFKNEKKSLAKGIAVLLAAMAVMVGCSTAKKNTVESKIEKKCS